MTGSRSSPSRLTVSHNRRRLTVPVVTKFWRQLLVGLTKRRNITSLVHGVSLSSRGSGRLRYRPRYAAYPSPSSSTFPHSSRLGSSGHRPGRSRQALADLLRSLRTASLRSMTVGVRRYAGAGRTAPWRTRLSTEDDVRENDV